MWTQILLLVICTSFGKAEEPTCTRTESYFPIGLECDCKYCTFKTTPGCYCKTGFVRNKKGECVPMGNCVLDSFCQIGDQNAEYSSCVRCQETCSNMQDELNCLDYCKTGCKCKDGYVRNDIWRCVEKSQCPSATTTSELTSPISKPTPVSIPPPTLTLVPTSKPTLTPEPTPAPTPPPTPPPTRPPTAEPTHAPATPVPTAAPVPKQPNGGEFIIKSPTPTARPMSQPAPRTTPRPTTRPTPSPTPRSTPRPTPRPTSRPIPNKGRK